MELTGRGPLHNAVSEVERVKSRSERAYRFLHWEVERIRNAERGVIVILQSGVRASEYR